MPSLLLYVTEEAEHCLNDEKDLLMRTYFPVYAQQSSSLKDINRRLQWALIQEVTNANY